MAFLNRPERWLALLALVGACALAPSPARSQPFWTADADISDGDVADTFTSLNNQRSAVVDDSNNLYITFFDNRNKVGTDDNYEIYLRKFIFNFGSPNITRATNFYNPSKYPSIATQNWVYGDPSLSPDSGRIYLAWQDARLFSIPSVGGPKSYTIFFRTYQTRGGTGFGPEIQVSPYDSINAATAPVLAVGDSSRVFIVYSLATSGDNDLYYAIYHSNTHVMDPPLPLEVDPGTNASLPSIAATRDGTINLVWLDNRNGGRQQIFWKQFIPGTGWTSDQQIVFNPGSSISNMPSLASSYRGHLHLVWRDNRDGNFEIYYKEYVPGVGWDLADTRLTVNSFSQLEPQVDADPRDNAYVVWTDTRNGASNPDIFYESRTGGVWGSETPLVYAATDTTNSVQHFPAITHDGLGQLYVAWSDDRLPSSNGKNHDVFYKVGYGFATSVETTEKPSLARLLRNYPNPFNPRTTVAFTLNRDAVTTLRVYDAQGRRVRTLIDGYVAAGRRTISWDGKDDGGRAVSSGVYFLRLQADGQFLSRTVNLLK